MRTLLKQGWAAPSDLFDLIQMIYNQRDGTQYVVSKMMLYNSVGPCEKTAKTSPQLFFTLSINRAIDTEQARLFPSLHSFPPQFILFSLSSYDLLMILPVPNLSPYLQL